MSFSEIRVYPFEVSLWAGQNYSLRATSFDVKGQKLDCSEFEWDSEDSQVATVSATGVITAISVGNTNVWAILKNQNLRFFGGKSLMKVNEKREFISPTGRKTFVIYDYRELPIFLEETNREGKIILQGQYIYHPRLDEIMTSVVQIEGRGTKIIVRDYDEECSLQDTTPPNEHPSDRALCVLEGRCDTSGQCKWYKKVIRNMQINGKSVAEIEDSLGRLERIIFEFPQANQLKITRQNAKGHTTEELYQLFSDGTTTYDLIVRYKDENGIITEFERYSDGKLKKIVKKGIGPNGEDYTIDIIKQVDKIIFRTNTGHEIHLFYDGRAEYIEKGLKKAEVSISTLPDGKRKTTTIVGGVQTEKIHDEFGRLYEVREIVNGITKRTVKYIYDEAGNLVAIDDGFLRQEIIRSGGRVVEERTVLSPLMFQQSPPMSPALFTPLSPPVVSNEILGGRRYYYDFENNMTASQSIAKGDGYGSTFNDFYEITEATYFSGNAKAVYEQEYGIDSKIIRRKRINFEDDIFFYDEIARLVLKRDNLSLFNEQYVYDELDRVKTRKYSYGIANPDVEEIFYDGENPLDITLQYSIGKVSGAKTSGYSMAQEYNAGGAISRQIKLIGDELFNISYIHKFGGISLDALYSQVGIIYPTGSSAYESLEEGLLSFKGKDIIRKIDSNTMLGNGLTYVYTDNEISLWKDNKIIFQDILTRDIDLISRNEITNEGYISVRFTKPGFVEVEGYEYYFPISPKSLTSSIKWIYDDAGNRISEIRKKGEQIENLFYEYSNDRLVSVKKNGTKVLEYRYDSKGRVFGISENGKVSVSLTYNNIGQVAQVSSNALGVWTSSRYFYDENSRRVRKVVNIKGCEIDTKFVYDKDGRLILEKTKVGRDGINLYTDLREYIWTRIDFPQGKPIAVKDTVINLDKRIGECFGAIIKTGDVSEIPISEETFQDDFSQPFQNNWNYGFISGTEQTPQNYVLNLTQAGGKLYVAISSEAGAPSETVTFMLIPKRIFSLQDFLFSVTMNVEEIRNSSFGLGNIIDGYPYGERVVLLCGPSSRTLANTICYLIDGISGITKSKSFPVSISEVGQLTYKMRYQGGNLFVEIPELGFSESVPFYPQSETFGYAVLVESEKFNDAESSIVKISFDHFLSNLKMKKTSFPYAEIEYLGERYNDYISELGGDISEKNNYWVIKNGTGINIFKDSGTGIFLDLMDERINMGLVINSQGRNGTIFTNLTEQEFESFVLSRGLRLVGYFEGVYRKYGMTYGMEFPEGITYFIPVKDRFVYIISDWRGVPKVAYDDFSNMVWRGEYGPFGEPLLEQGVKNFVPFVLYGMYKDLETGLYYNIRRYYDYRIGRYIQPDPVPDLNLYAYVDNSPYNFLDPSGMFKTSMQAAGFLWHAGSPVHEEITESAISSLKSCYGYNKLYSHGFRVENWDGGSYLYGIIAQCRGYENTVAQGANRVDCIYEDDSSYHCDNNNFGDFNSGCYQKAFQINSPVSSGLVRCECSGSWSGGGGGGSGGGGGGGGSRAGCSILGILKPSSSCTCSFQNLKDYEHLGQFLHPVQDFWSHSTALFVPACKRTYCKTKLLVCTDYECAEYEIYKRWTGPQIVGSNTASSLGIISGLFGGGGWGVLEDVFCLWPPCNAHCMLNKDDPGNVDRDCMSHCEPGCTGDESIQRAAHTDAKQIAIESTKFYLRSFCFNAPDLCY